MARTAKGTTKGGGHKWSQAQREKFMQTREAKLRMQSGNSPVLEIELQDPQTGLSVTQAAEARAGGYSFSTGDPLEITLPVETLAERSLGDVIHAAEVLGFHIEIRVRSNGRSDKNREHTA